MRYQSFCLLFLVYCAKSEDTFNFTDVCFEFASKSGVKYCETVSNGRLVDVLPKRAKKIEITRQNLSNILEDSFGDITDCKQLHINNCGVQYIEPGAFKKSASFQIINLEHNLLKEVRKGVFSDVVNLKHLLLSYNEINSVDKEAFENLQYLIEIDLSNNKLTRLDPACFYNVRSLNLLHFENNSIEGLQNHFFENLNGGISIFLSYNKIKSVEADVFHGMKNKMINKFYVDHNQITNWSENLSSNIIDLKINHNNITCPNGIFKNIIKNSSIENFEHNPYDCLCLKEIKTWTDEHGKHSEWFKDIYLKCREESRLYRRRPMGMFRGIETYIRNFN